MEAGIRSGDMDMPEEINRILTDSITDIFFTTSISAGENLHAIGVSDKKIYFVGNTMIDTLMHKRNDFICPDVWFVSGLKPQNYLLLTLHRPSNVSDYTYLQNILETICSVRGDIPIVFPVHPRTQKSISKLNSLPKQLLCIDPLPYLEFMYLVNSAVAVITDSGGITEEATVLNVPCLTVRDNTERPETIEIGSNCLVGSDPAAIKRVLNAIFSGSYKKSSIPSLWDGKASERICECILNVINSRDFMPSLLSKIIKLTFLYARTISYLRFSQLCYRFFYMVNQPSLNLRVTNATYCSPVALIGMPKAYSCVDARGHIYFFGGWLSQNQIKWNAGNNDKLRQYNLHYFDFLNGNNLKKTICVETELVSDWMSANPPCKTIGWDAYPTSLRIINWIKWSHKVQSLPRGFAEKFVFANKMAEEEIRISFVGKSSICKR